MRFQKLVVISLFVGLISNSAYSQTALSVRKTSAKYDLTMHQKQLEDKADAAEVAAKEFDAQATVAKQNLDELQRSGVTLDRKTAAQRQLELRAEVARAEAEAAHSRAEAARNRTASIQDQADVAAKSSQADPSKDKKTQAKHFDAIWLQKLAAVSEKEFTKMDTDASRKLKIANEAEKKAQAAGSQVKTAEPKKIARPTNVAEEDAQKAQAAAQRAEAQKISRAQEKQDREREAALKKEQEALRKAQANEAEKQAKVREKSIETDKISRAQEKQDRERAAALKKEQEALRKAQANEAALQAQAEKEAAHKAKVEQEAVRKAEEMAKSKEREAMRAQEAAASEARQKAKSEEFFRAKKAEAAHPVKTPIQKNEPAIATPATPTAVTPVPSASDDQLVEILRRKQAELDAKEAGSKVTAPEPIKVKPVVVEPQASVAPRPVETQISKPAPVVTETPKVIAQPKVVIAQPAVDQAAEDRLVEILRQKQAELDAKERVASSSNVSAPTTFKQVEPQKSKTSGDISAKDREESEKRIRQIEAEIKAKEMAIKKSVDSPPSVGVQKVEAKRLASEVKAQAIKNTAAPADLNSKEARLDELLRKYKADEITPRDYHLQRAKIVAEP